MKRTRLSNVISAVVIAVISITSSFGQVSDLNNGSECGCPSVSSRQEVDLATLAVTLSADQSEIQTNTTLTCDKIYTIDKKIFVGYGITLTIQPGTVI